MARKLVTVQKILDIQPIPGADKIEVAQVKDWKVVVKKDEFKIGDSCLYYEIDSFLPVKSQYEFLLKGSKTKKMLIDGKEAEGIRLKTIKLRGQISQGLILPLPEKYLTCEEGKDLSEELGVHKYERTIPACLSGEIKGSFPAFLPKTDEERIQNCGDIIGKHIGEEFYITSKLDGTSATYYKYQGVFGCCSRNLELKDGKNSYWEMARKYEIEKVLPEGYCIQGEIIGEGIQGNPLKLNGQSLHIYNVYDIQKCKFLDFADFKKFLFDLGTLMMVPTTIMSRITFTNDLTVEDLLKLAEDKSPLNLNEDQEGIVIRPLTEKQEVIGGVLTRLSFKVISNRYLLKNDN